MDVKLDTHRIAAAFWEYRDSCQNLHLLHQALHSAPHYPNICPGPVEEDQDMVCLMGCDLVQPSLLHRLGSRCHPSMCQ